jgi:hypothetical protein
MDSFFEDPRPKCCDPFPEMNLKLCWEADSNYCTTCGRWLEHPQDVGGLRAERHTKACPNEYCSGESEPKFCTCGHNTQNHHKSMLLRDMPEDEEEILKLIQRMRFGPHNCELCDCRNWQPNYDGLCD